jgi:dipeptidyl aminopeptidase/acylaminoacyl peptidase
MKNRIWSLVALTVVITAASAQTPSTKADMILEDVNRIPVKDFFRNPTQVSFQVSPSGEYISYRAPWKDRMNVFVKNLKTDEVMQVTKETTRDVGGYMWKGDRILYTRDLNGDENYIVYSASIDGSEQKALTPEKGVRAGILDAMRGIEGMEKMVMIQMNKRNPQVFDPYLVNVETGDMKSLVDNTENFESWVTDHNGIIRIASKTDGTNVRLYHRASASEPFREFMSTDFRNSFGVQMFTFDNKNLIVSSNIGRDKQAIVEWDMEAQKEARVIYENKDYDVAGVDYSRKRKVLTMATYEGAKQNRVFLDKETEMMYEKMAPQFTGYDFWIYGEDESETKMVVWAGNDRMPGVYYFYDSEMDKVEKLATPYDWLKETDMAEMKPISYQSRDGLTIHGYLTVPNGMDAKNLPVVVNPHGGPWARDSWGYNPEVQMLANRGYAVLQMNFRGSVGYGRDFWEASFKQWGQTMQNDITDGVEWLIKEGIADPDRIAIYGASYGGYATLAGITFTPDLYACAVDYVGVSNLFTFLSTIPPYWAPYLEMMHEMVGHPEKDKEMMTAASPVFHVDKIKCPLFIAQGAQDPRVKKDESDQVVAAMKERGIEVEYMVKENEGHGFRNEENRFEFYEAMEKFLDQHIGDGTSK